MRYGTRSSHKGRWTPRGIRPECKVKLGYEWGYLYLAIQPSRGYWYGWFMPDMSKASLSLFLDHFSKQLTEPSKLILDGAASHRSNLALGRDLSFLFLPSYSPELNPVERCFGELRKSISNQVFDSLSEVEEVLRTKLLNYKKAPSSLVRLTNYSWLV